MMWQQQQQQRELPDLTRPDQAADGLGLALAAQHAELAQMRAQMASLRQDLLAAARRSAGPGDAAAAAAPSEVRALSILCGNIQSHNPLLS